MRELMAAQVVVLDRQQDGLQRGDTEQAVGQHGIQDVGIELQGLEVCTMCSLVSSASRPSVTAAKAVAQCRDSPRVV